MNTLKVAHDIYILYHLSCLPKVGFLIVGHAPHVGHPCKISIVPPKKQIPAKSIIPSLREHVLDISTKCHQDPLLIVVSLCRQNSVVPTQEIHAPPSFINQSLTLGPISSPQVRSIKGCFWTHTMI